MAAQERGSQLIEDKNKFNPDGSRIDTKNYSRSGTFDQTGGSMNIGGNLDMSAGNDFVAQGTQINAAGGVNISAGNDATITTAQKGSYYESVSTEKKKTWWGLGSRTTTITHTNTDLTNTAASINGGSVNINAGNDTTVIGANINGAGGVNIHGGNNTNILAAYDIKEKIDTKTVKSNDFGRFMDTLKQSATNAHITPIHDATDTYSTGIDSTRKAVLTNINGGSGNVSLTAGNTLNLQAPIINGASFTYGGGNQTNFIAAIDSREISQSSGGRNFHWQVNQSQGSKTETLHMTNVNVPTGMTKFVGAGGISVQLPKGSSLATQIATLSQQPGNEYLVDLAKRSDIDWKQVEVINKTWDYKKGGLTQEAAIIVAIVVTIFTAGAASTAAGSLVGTGTTAAGATTITAGGLAATTGMSVGVAAATTTAVAAGITTLATQATIALINSQGDISAALKELGSKENLKALGTAIVTAGVVQGLGQSITFTMPDGSLQTLAQIGKAGGDASLLHNLGANLINGVASTLVSTAINGGSLEDNLKNMLKNVIISTAGAQLADGIGDLKAGDLDKFAGTLAHAILGCGMGAATVGNSSGCAPGAGGAVVGELSAEWYGKTFGGNPQNAADFAKLTTALVAGAAGGASAMNVAGITSNNAVVNNYLNHTQWSKFASDIAACKAKATGCTPAEEKAITARYQDISTKQNIALANCDATKNCAALKAEVALGTITMMTLADTKQIPIGGAPNNDLGQYIGQRLASDPAYRRQVNESIAVLNKCNANPDQCTQQAIKAAAIVVLPLLGVAGVGFSAAGVVYGGSIGATGNIAGQLVANGGQPSQINPSDVAMAAYTGALTYGATLWPSLFINTGGAVVTSAVNGSSATDAGRSMAGAAAGTLVGYPLGAIAQGGLNNILNP